MIACTMCYSDSETLKRVVLKCTRLCPALPKGVADLTRALGFAGEDGRTAEQRIAIVIRRTLVWVCWVIMVTGQKGQKRRGKV